MTRKIMTKLNNIIIIFSCMFTGSCFTGIQQKNNANDLSRICVNNETNPLHDDCMGQENPWAKTFYKQSPKMLGFNATGGVQDLSLKFKR